MTARSISRVQTLVYECNLQFKVNIKDYKFQIEEYKFQFNCNNIKVIRTFNCSLVPELVPELSYSVGNCVMVQEL